MNRAASGLPPLAPALRVRQLVRAFGPRRVLDELNLDIAPGEFVAVLGLSGTGKTTLLRTLAGLDEPDGGALQVPPVQAMLFGQARLMPWKPLWANVVLGAPIAHAQRRATALAALAEVGLADLAQARPRQLDAGQAQRAALARCMVRAPQLLLLDEPFALLDGLTRLHLQQLTLRLWRQYQPAVLLATHDIDEAITLADRLVLLQGGRILEQIRITLPRPRDGTQPAFNALRQRLLGLLRVNASTPEPTDQGPGRYLIYGQPLSSIAI
ncbi:ATP-binding cassette domain-containing protein [Pseudomonas sp. NPDC007930]|uniref:ABC transporter ATP-binding protein n=1 Tax=Pseudomonas sp. NPDC007930 TaxID=3364417 RepID=UPI0036EFB402